MNKKILLQFIPIIIVVAIGLIIININQNNYPKIQAIHQQKIWDKIWCKKS